MEVPGAWLQPILRRRHSLDDVLQAKWRQNGLVSKLKKKNVIKTTKARLGACAYGYKLFQHNMIKQQN